MRLFQFLRIMRILFVFCLFFLYAWRNVIGDDREHVVTDKSPNSSNDARSAEIYFPHGFGNIPIASVEDYPRIHSTTPILDSGLSALWRPNLVGQPVEREWDFSNLINTDRSDFTDATTAVGKGVLYVENGYTYRHIKTSTFDFTRTSIPESLVRIGVTDALEFRLKWNGAIVLNYVDQQTGLRRTSDGGDDLLLSVKYEVWQQQNLLPMMTFVGGSTVPSGSGSITAGVVQPNAQLVFGWGIRRWLYLKVSSGVDFNRVSNPIQIVTTTPGETILVVEKDNVIEIHQSASLLFQVSKRLGGFAEWYALVDEKTSDTRPQNFLDTGLFMYLHPHLQADLKVGQQVGNSEIDHVFAGGGLSFRF